jgi:hypothetical protein
MNIKNYNNLITQISFNWLKQDMDSIIKDKVDIFF